MDLKTKLLNALAVKPVPFTIKAAGAEVSLMPWQADTRQKFQAKVNAHKKATGGQPLPDLYESLFVSSICDEQGALLFTEDEIAAARVLNGQALEEVAEEVIRLNGLESDDEKKAPSPTTTS